MPDQKRPNTMPKSVKIIAIDGPAASGKSTVAKIVADELGLTFLDTGAMYRAVTLAALQRGIDPHDETGCAGVASALRLTFDAHGAILIDGRPGGPAIRSEAVTRAVSPVSAHPLVRAAVVPLQRLEAERRGGLVAEGRDIGSVVFPEADFKFYLDASSEERARRRVEEIGAPERFHEIHEAIRLRDHMDSTRKDSPLTVARGAILIHTDGLDALLVAARMLAAMRGNSAHG